MRTAMRSMQVLAVALAVAACSSDESGDGRPIDAAREDGPVDAPPIDAPRDASTENGVVCEIPDQVCDLPAQECCLLPAGTDSCVSAVGSCPGERFACDGPEDCGLGTDCCWFEGQGSRCIAQGNCGFTGSISAVMCHILDDCHFSFPNCCVTTPGPASNLYPTCSFSPCP